MSNKKQRDIELFIVDIFVSIQKIDEYTNLFDNPSDLQHSSLHWDATIRQLEVIGEALNNLLNNDTFNRLAPKYFRKIVNFRNAIVHGYFGIDLDEVWDIITDKLKILKENIDISSAIESSINEYQKMNDINIVKFLIKLENNII
ncbi:MAG: HepT-like ribonuclease domain-containing protein [Campylobacterota bacterium]|nr:HepT-like ribonuclease domain-containing protein [Campylobacterota bacterium]